jgi:DNA-binding NarL/FixJ family response regulator
MGAPGPQARTKVLLVLGSRLLAGALAVVLGDDRELDVVGVLTDPDLVMAELHRTRPDVVLVDHQADGVRLAAAVVAGFPAPSIVILIPSLDQEILLACAEAGAVGYLTMEQPPEALGQAIKRAHAGEVLFAPALLHQLLVRARHAGRAREVPPPTQPLAPRETHVLQLLATGLRPEAVADRLGISIHTVRSHLNNVMAKLQAHSKLEAVVVALGAGLIELPGGAPQPLPFPDLGTCGDAPESHPAGRPPLIMRLPDRDREVGMSTERRSHRDRTDAERSLEGSE